MTRIIAGRARGRRLKTPSGDSTRPTTDRVREALFSAIESRHGSLAGQRFLDLFAGSGAVGLEAWSRGADFVTFVERDRRTATLLQGNATQIGFAAPDVWPLDVGSVLRRRPVAPYDVVFGDPPYAHGDDDVDGLLELVVTGGWLADDSLVVLERSSRSRAPDWPAGIRATWHRRYGETALWFGETI
ncbi:MAG: 16S rRNA (guanine(966)-N(2))-methyltransferase RsmD [Nocardioides sp.]